MHIKGKCVLSLMITNTIGSHFIDVCSLNDSKAPHQVFVRLFVLALKIPVHQRVIAALLWEARRPREKRHSRFGPLEQTCITACSRHQPSVSLNTQREMFKRAKHSLRPKGPSHGLQATSSHEEVGQKSAQAQA